MNNATITEQKYTCSYCKKEIGVWSIHECDQMRADRGVSMPWRLQIAAQLQASSLADRGVTMDWAEKHCEDYLNMADTLIETHYKTLKDKETK